MATDTFGCPRLTEREDSRRPVGGGRDAALERKGPPPRQGVIGAPAARSASLTSVSLAKGHVQTQTQSRLCGSPST